MQSNLTPGLRLNRLAGADLSAKEGFVVMLDSSDAIQIHTGAVRTPYVLIDAPESGECGIIDALDPTEPKRVKSADAHVIHTPVYLDVATGKATATASAIRLGFALETKGSGEGNVLIRPYVAIQPITTLTALGQTISGSYSQSEVQAISTKVDAVIAALKKAN